MPANAGIQVRFQFKFKNCLDSAGMTGTRVDFQSTNSEPLGLEPRVVQLIVRTKRRRCDLAMGHGDDSECSRVLSLIESRAGGAHQLLRAFWTELTLLGDLRGRTVQEIRFECRNGSDLGGIEETAARVALDRLAVGARNVSFLQAGPDPLRIAALDSGTAQATMLAPPGLFAATSRGLNLLADLGALKIKYPASVVSGRRSYLIQDRAVAKRFLMALMDGLHVYRQNKSFAVKVLEKYTKLTNADILSQSYDYFAKNSPLLPMSDGETIQVAVPTDKPGNRKVEEFYDNSILEELEREGFVKTLSK